MTQTKAAEIIGCTKARVSEYMNKELGPIVKKQMREASDEADALNVTNALKEARNNAVLLYDEALTIPDVMNKIRMALRANRENMRACELIARVTGQSGPDTQINVYNAGNIKLVSVVLKVFERHPEIPDYFVDEMITELRAIEANE
jgi:predicted transcriptional regulator